MSAIHVAQFFQYELGWIKDVLDRLTAEQFVYARTRADPPVPVCTLLYPSVASSSDSLTSGWRQAVTTVTQAQAGLDSSWP